MNWSQFKNNNGGPIDNDRAACKSPKFAKFFFLGYNTTIGSFPATNIKEFNMGTKVQVMLGGIVLMLAVTTFKAGEAAGMAKCGGGETQSSTAAASSTTISPCRERMVVTQGQTLGQLALYYGTTVGAIAKANGLSNPNNIRVGQVLCIP